MTVNALMVCLTLVVLSGVAIFSLIEIDRNKNKVVHNYIPSLSAAAEINSGTRKIMVLLGRLGNARTEDRRQDILRRIDETLNTNNEAFKSYEACIITQVNRDMYEAAVQKRDVFRNARKQYLELLATKTDQAEKFFEGELESTYTDYMKVVDQMLAFNLKGSHEKGVYLDQIVATTITTVTAVSLVGIALGVIGSVVSIRSINSALRRICNIIGNNSGQVAAAAGQVSASSQILAQGASESAASIEETSSSMVPYDISFDAWRKLPEEAGSSR